MRLKVHKAPEIFENGNKRTTTLGTDDNSNDTLCSEKLSTLDKSVKWVWNGPDKQVNNYSYNQIKLQPPSNSQKKTIPEVKVTTAGDSEEGGSGSSCCESSDSEEENPLVRRSFSNPNYPGFQHLAHELSDSFNNNKYNNNINNNNNNNNNEDDEKEIDSVNKLESVVSGPKEIYVRPKLMLGPPVEKEENEIKTNNMEVEKVQQVAAPRVMTKVKDNKAIEEKGEGDTRKREKLSRSGKRQEKKEAGFDVYNIETAMPKIDLEAIESHLRAAREEERRRRNDREEIRRRLATGCDSDEFYGNEKSGKKPSLQARLQSGMNLQICFMNETGSDTESPSSESLPPTKDEAKTPVQPKQILEPPKTLNLLHKNTREMKGMVLPTSGAGLEGDFFTRQARLQAEARLALSQAKDRARLQMEADRLSGKASPITEMLRSSLKKVGIHFPDERRRVSRQMLTDMNIAQLQVIVNDLHTQIESLNEGLVKYLMERDELHMSQDSMLVDIEDVTRYLGAKESCLKEDIARNNNLAPPLTKPVITRIVSLGKK